MIASLVQRGIEFRRISFGGVNNVEEYLDRYGPDALIQKLGDWFRPEPEPVQEAWFAFLSSLPY